VSLLSVETSRGEDSVRVTLGGELDLSSALVLEEELRRLEAHRPAELTFDLGELRFLDSTGLRVILSAHARAKRDRRRFRIVNVTEAVLRIFRLTGVADRLNVVPA
jgi:anti-anti-sigma factor